MRFRKRTHPTLRKISWKTGVPYPSREREKEVRMVKGHRVWEEIHGYNTTTASRQDCCQDGESETAIGGNVPPCFTLHHLTVQSCHRCIVRAPCAVVFLLNGHLIVRKGCKREKYLSLCE